MEEAGKSMMKLMSNMVGDLSNAFYKKYGKDSLPIIAKVSAKFGADSAKIVQKMMSVKNMKDFAEVYKMMMASMGEKLEISKVSDNVFHFKTSHCPMGLERGSQELCEAMMASDDRSIVDRQHDSHQSCSNSLRESWLWLRGLRAESVVRQLGLS